MKTTPFSDDEILQLLQEPQSYQKGFRLLLSKYKERLYWHIRRMVDHHEDANDVVQNCFVKVYRNIHKFEGKSKLYTWLYRIATNEALTLLEKRKRIATTSLDHTDAAWHNRLEAGTEINGTTAESLLRQALTKLPEKQRMVFEMRYFEELNYNTISENIGTSVGALKASYHHAVKKIEAFVKANAT